MQVDDIRAFLSQYADGESYQGNNRLLSDGTLPPDIVRQFQNQTDQEPDEHVIPDSLFEYRLGVANSAPPGTISTDENIHRIERMWDALISQYGLDAFSTYIPFHTDTGDFGIYISQRGIRYLGHLLYHWSKQPQLRERQTGDHRTVDRGFLIAGPQLLSFQSPFESKEAALDLAYEIFHRYQWFHHQFELLAAYMTDANGEASYISYFKEYRVIDAPRADLPRSVAHQYVARSQACRNKAPETLFDLLFSRTLKAFSSSNKPVNTSGREFESGCLELSQALRSDSGGAYNLPPLELSRRLPFSTDIDRAIPRKIALYITRRENESDDDQYAVETDTDTITNQPKVHPWGDQTEYAISSTDEYDRKYERADWNIKELLDNRIDSIRESFETQDWQGVNNGRHSYRYIKLSKSSALRLIVSVDEDAKTVELVDFGNRMQTPRKYGLHNSQN
jgi:mRNA-degrading endonuclease RelE of RelBE toxin-antitoxin system